MLRRLRHRLHRRLRIALVLMFALGMVMQTALSAAGQVHDAFAHADHASMPHHESPDAHADDAEGQAGDTTAAIHFLMHYAHCCGSTTAMLSVAPLLLPTDAASTALVVRSDSGRAQERPDHPFRPPIAA